MSIKGLEAQRNYPLNKKLKEILWGSWCMQTNWNYERQMNTAFMYGMSKTIDRLYPDPDEVDKKKKHIKDTLSSLISHHSVQHWFSVLVLPWKKNMLNTQIHLIQVQSMQLKLL